MKDSYRINSNKSHALDCSCTWVELTETIKAALNIAIARIILCGHYEAGVVTFANHTC